MMPPSRWGPGKVGSPAMVPRISEPEDKKMREALELFTSCTILILLDPIAGGVCTVSHAGSRAVAVRMGE